MSGIISEQDGSKNLHLATRNNAGAGFILSGENTYTGNTTIGNTGFSNGTIVRLSNSSALGAGNGATVTFGAHNTSLQMEGGITISQKELVLKGSGYQGRGSLQNRSGNNEWSGGVDLGERNGTIGNATIGVDTGTLVLSGVVKGAQTSGTGTASGLHKAGGGILELKNTANTYSNGTIVNEGTLRFHANGSLGNAGGSVTLLNDSTLQWASGNSDDISGRLVTLGAGGGRMDTNGNNVNLAQGIGNGGVGALYKAGAGTLILGGENSYTGDTIVGSGALQVDGGLSAQSGVSVLAGAKLAGSGTVRGNAEILSGGILAAGDALDVGLMSFQQTLTVSSGGEVLFRLLGGGEGAAGERNLAGSVYDSFVVDHLVLNENVVLTVDVQALTVSNSGSWYQLFDFNTLQADGFNSVTAFQFQGLSGDLMMDTSLFLSTGSIGVVAIPEGASLAYLFLGGFSHAAYLCFRNVVWSSRLSA